jgi:AcrR family transcriptional regulator
VNDELAPLNDEQLHHIRDERKEQIMGAALKVFSRRGIIGTKMSMIAVEAGMSHGLLYHYFKSKEELFITLVEHAMIAAQDAMRNVYDYPGSPIDKIKSLTEDMLDESGTDYFMLIHQARTSEGVPEKVKQLIEDYSMKAAVNQLLPLFQEGQADGQIIAGDLEEMIASYLSVVNGLMVLNVQEIGGYQIPKVNILLRMISPN